MRKTLASLGLVSLLVLPALPAAATPPPAQAAAAKRDAVTSRVVKACDLLTSKDIQSVQGEALKKAVGHESVRGGLTESQCYFALPTGSKSISLSVTTVGKGKGAEDFRTFRDAFHRPPPKKKPYKAPTKIAGLGREAFWASSASGGNLYVFNDDRFFRLSVGGPGDQAQKLKKSKALARMVLARL